jgi:hypothetical protein
VPGKSWAPQRLKEGAIFSWGKLPPDHRITFFFFDLFCTKITPGSRSPMLNTGSHSLPLNPGSRSLPLNPGSRSPMLNPGLAPPHSPRLISLKRQDQDDPANHPRDRDKILAVHREPAIHKQELRHDQAKGKKDQNKFSDRLF